MGSWFESDYKKEYARTVEAERKQREVLNAEIDTINQEHFSRVYAIDSAISNHSRRIEDLRRKNDAERAAKEKEISDDKKRHADMMQDLEDSYERNKANAGNESKEKLKELQLNYKRERDELNGAHKQAIDGKNQELKNLKNSHRADMANIEQEKKNIHQQRKDEITSHDAKIASMKTKHTKEVASELNKIKEIKKKVLAQQRDAIRAETELQTEQCNLLLTAQISKANAVMERDLADCIALMMQPISSSASSLKQLAQIIEHLDDDSDSFDLLLIQNSNSEWTESNMCTEKSTLRLRQMLNNYSSINEEFRKNIFDITNEVDKNLLEVQSLPLAIKQAVDKEDHDALKALAPKIDVQLKTLDGISLKLRQVGSGPDKTLEILKAGTPEKPTMISKITSFFSYLTGTDDKTESTSTGSTSTVSTTEQKEQK